jgi:two-component system chemotaxis response regulator CheB
MARSKKPQQKNKAPRNNSPKTKAIDSFYVVCIGASAGGFHAVTELISQLPKSINAAVFIVLHFSKGVLGDVIADRIKRETALPCNMARPHEKIQRGHVYLAVPDAHLLIKKGEIVLGHGPAENRFRPSIDVLFRSAASSYCERTIGVVLTGMLNDGTVGMSAIKQSGGYAVVQDPNEAEYPDMPQSVLEMVEVDHVVSLKKMGAVITAITKNKAVRSVLPPPEVIAESRLSEMAATGLEHVSKLGKKTDFACPDCGGGLWTIQSGKMKHLRCHIGHSYTEEELVVRQAESIEQTMWVAIRMMEERKILFSNKASEYDKKGLGKLAASYRSHASHLDAHIQKMKEFLFKTQKQ